LATLASQLSIKTYASARRLQAAGCDKVFTDKASGKKLDRAGLIDALAFAREGDTLVVWKLDRLGRSMKGLVDLAAELMRGRSIFVRSLTVSTPKEPLDAFFFHVLLPWRKWSGN
jgi:DNA invertase Pin-like site-specific DNA recombinase